MCIHNCMHGGQTSTFGIVPQKPSTMFVSHPDLPGVHPLDCLAGKHPSPPVSALQLRLQANHSAWHFNVSSGTQILIHGRELSQFPSPCSGILLAC